MSMWVHITACLSVETGFVEKPNVLKKIIQKELKSAPKITGSEGCADVFVNIQSGFNLWLNKDCNHCPYSNTIVWTGEGKFTCDPPKGYKCKPGEFQTCVTISVQGDLRDKTKQETIKEFEEFLDFIRTRHYVRDYAVNIVGD